MKILAQVFEHEERAHAFSEHQLRNHLLHAGVAVVVYAVVRWGLGLHPVHAVVWLVAIGGVKEYAETVRKLLLQRTVWLLDSMLDFAGWLLPPVILALLFG